MATFKIWILKKINDASELMLEEVNIDRKRIGQYPFSAFDQMLREFTRDIAVTGDKVYNDYLTGITGGYLEFSDWMTGVRIYRSDQPVDTLKWVNLPLGINEHKSLKPKMKVEGKADIEYVLVAVHVTESLVEMLKTAFEFEESVSRHAGIKSTYLNITHALQVYLNRRLNDIYKIIMARIEGKRAEEELKVEGKETLKNVKEIDGER